MLNSKRPVIVVVGKLAAIHRRRLAYSRALCFLPLRACNTLNPFQSMKRGAKKKF